MSSACRTGRHSERCLSTAQCIYSPEWLHQASQRGNGSFKIWMDSLRESSPEDSRNPQRRGWQYIYEVCSISCELRAPVARRPVLLASAQADAVGIWERPQRGISRCDYTVLRLVHQQPSMGLRRHMEEDRRSKWWSDTQQAIQGLESRTSWRPFGYSNNDFRKSNRHIWKGAEALWKQTNPRYCYLVDGIELSANCQLCWSHSWPSAYWNRRRHERRAI